MVSVWVYTIVLMLSVYSVSLDIIIIIIGLELGILVEVVFIISAC